MLYVSLSWQLLAQGSQFTLEEVEVISATVDLEDIRSYRASVGSRGIQVREGEGEGGREEGREGKREGKEGEEEGGIAGLTELQLGVGGYRWEREEGREGRREGKEREEEGGIAGLTDLQ